MHALMTMSSPLALNKTRLTGAPYYFLYSSHDVTLAVSDDGPVSLSTVPSFTANGSSPSPEYSSAPVAITQIFFSTAGLFFNVVIFVSYLLSPKLRTPQNVFTINLAVADFILLVQSFLPVAAALSGRGRDAYGAFCDLYAFVIIVNAYSSIAFIGVIGLTRYICICHPHLKGCYFMWWKCVLFAVLIWLYSVVLTLPALTGWGRFTYNEKLYMCGYDFTYNMKYNVILILGTFGVVSVVMFFCYLNIYRTFAQSKDRVRLQSAPGGQRRVKNDELRLAIQFMVIFVIYNLCWGPIMMLVFIIDPLSKADIRIYEAVQFFMYTNSVVNGPLYMYFNRTFRSEVLRIWLHVETVQPAGNSSLGNGQSLELTEPLKE